MSPLVVGATVKTVHRRQHVVNTLPTVRTDQGDRLRQFIERRWPRSRGGLRGFCAAAGIHPETLYAWFRGETEPNLGSLGQLAATLGVRRWEIVAAMDGDTTTQLSPETEMALETMIRSTVERILDERGIPPAPRPRSVRSAR
jgi:hypothetical protein